MVELFMERHFEPGLAPADVLAMGGAAGGCYDLYRIQWLESFLSRDGHTLICHFLAPDAEALRTAMRVTSGEVPPLWVGNVFGSSAGSAASVAVTRRFDEAVRLDDLQAREQRGQACLQAYGVEAERSILSQDGRRMICLYRAPDAESVRRAQLQAGMPVERVWAFQRLSPADLAPA